MSKDMKLIMENWWQFSKNDLKKIDRLFSKNLHEVSNIKDPFFRRKLKNISLKTEDCQVYLKESGGTIKYIGFDQLIESRNSGRITNDEMHDIWETSCKYDADMFVKYTNLHSELFDEMLSDGLITEYGSTTNKGKLLQEEEEELTEQQINEIVSGLILEQEDDELSPEEIAATKTTGQRAMGAIGRGLKKMGGAAMAPFKLLKWFRDKIWNFLEGMIKKLWAAIKTLGEKWDIKWIQNFTGAVEAVVGKINKFCGKNKFTQIVCGVVKSLLIAYAVKLFITAFIALVGASITSVGAAALAGCGAVAAGAVSADATLEEGARKTQLNEASGALCDAAAQAGQAAATYTFKAVKGIIKMMIVKQEGLSAEVGKEALNFVDKYSEMYLKTHRGSVHAYGYKTEQLDGLLGAAKQCGSDGAKVVARAINWMKKTITVVETDAVALAKKAGVSNAEGQKYPQVVAWMADLRDLGDATSAKSNFNMLNKTVGWAKEAIAASDKGDPSLAVEYVNGLKKLATSLGYDGLDKNFDMLMQPKHYMKAGKAGKEIGGSAYKVARSIGRAAAAVKG